MLRSFKKMLPKWVKFIPWYLFKSPQRQEGVSFTWYVEVKGFFSWLPKMLVSKKSPISICTGIKNRTDNYLNYVLDSILKMKDQNLIEISVFDCGSEDRHKLELEIRKRWSGKMVFNSEEMDFTRSESFNKAIRQANNEIIFASDADMILPVDLVRQCNRHVGKNYAWFPVCFDLYRDKPAKINKKSGRWLRIGMGMFASTRQQFEMAGGYDERFKTWGGEDLSLWLRFYRAGILPVRTKCRGLFHTWHPSLNPKKYTN